MPPWFGSLHFGDLATKIDQRQPEVYDSPLQKTVSLPHVLDP